MIAKLSLPYVQKCPQGVRSARYFCKRIFMLKLSNQHWLKLLLKNQDKHLKR